MRAWLDACTGKHIRYATAVARALRARGHEVVLTTREHPDTLALARALGEDFKPVGRYAPGSMVDKLRESVKRELALTEIFSSEDLRPDVAICHQSVELCRVAFGLGIPVICTSDTPHATAVGRLTIPLSDVLVVSEALPRGPYEAMGARRIEVFKGVDEVAWLSRPGLTAPRENLSWLDELKRPIIVVREEEHGAAYARGKGIMVEVARALRALGTVVFLARYGRPPDLPDDIVVPEGFVDGVLLTGEADLVVGIGGTLCREAALQGTPTLVVPYVGRIHVNDYLAEKGFPIIEVGLDEVLMKARELLGHKKDVRSLLEGLEDPVDLIVALAEELAQGPQQS